MVSGSRTAPTITRSPTITLRPYHHPPLLFLLAHRHAVDQTHEALSSNWRAFDQLGGAVFAHQHHREALALRTIPPTCVGAFRRLTNDVNH